MKKRTGPATNDKQNSLASTLSRRSFIRGAGMTIALPFFESLAPWVNVAEAQAAVPPRFVVLYKPNGDHPGNWGTNFTGALAPLSPWKQHLTILRGLNNVGARNYSDGHAPMLSAFLTGGPLNASTSIVNAPKSIDQIIADARGTKSLTPAGPFSMETTNGFNGEYFSSLSWVGPRAATKIMSPSALFDQIFKGAVPLPPSQEAILKAYKKSILDYSKEETDKKRAQLGMTDRAKLDEYLNGVRELEVAIGKLEPQVIQCTADMPRPGDTQIFAQHTQIMLDLIVKALQCGRSSVVAYMLDCEVGYGYDNHHQYSHYKDNASYVDRLRTISTWYMTQLAYFMQKLNAVVEPDGTTLLNNTMIIYGGGSGDSHDHTPNDLRLIVAGRAKGTLNPGRDLTLSNVPLSNLLLTSLNKMGVNRTSFGGSTGIISGL